MIKGSIGNLVIAQTSLQEFLQLQDASQKLDENQQKQVKLTFANIKLTPPNFDEDLKINRDLLTASYYDYVDKNLMIPKIDLVNEILLENENIKEKIEMRKFYIDFNIDYEPEPMDISNPQLYKNQPVQNNNNNNANNNDNQHFYQNNNNNFYNNNNNNNNFYNNNNQIQFQQQQNQNQQGYYGYLPPQEIQELSEEQKLINQFVEISSCSVSDAEYYLKHGQNNITKAYELYLDNIERKEQDQKLQNFINATGVQKDEAVAVLIKYDYNVQAAIIQYNKQNAMLKEFIQLTSETMENAQFWLESTSWNLQEAYKLFEQSKN